MEENIKLILESLKNIESRLTVIEQTLNKNTTKMESHIDFIENTYNVVRTPLNYIKNKVECIMGNSSATKQKDLPQIKNNSD